MTETATVRVQRIMPAAPDVVFDEWLDRESLQEWMCPRPVRVVDVTVEADGLAALRAVRRARQPRACGPVDGRRTYSGRTPTGRIRRQKASSTSPSNRSVTRRHSCRSSIRCFPQRNSRASTAGGRSPSTSSLPLWAIGDGALDRRRDERDRQSAGWLVEEPSRCDRPADPPTRTVDTDTGSPRDSGPGAADVASDRLIGDRDSARAKGGREFGRQRDRPAGQCRQRTAGSHCGDIG